MSLLYKALIKFQAQLKPVTKDSENPFYKSNYADLSSLLQVVIPILNSCDLAIIQPIKIDGDRTILQTTLLHSSGEILASEMILPSHPDPQKFGSLLSYYKRYQLQALLGVSTKDEDDDGNHASNKTQINTIQKPKDKPTFSISDSMPKSVATFPASDAQKNALTRMGIKFPETITKSEASKLIEEANKRN